MNSSWARVRIRLRSSEGWKEKSKPASVLTAVSRAITSAVLMRRLSRTVSSSASRVSMASSGETSPRSSWRTVRSRTSSARGILRPTRVRRIRSRMAGTISVRRSCPLSLAGETAADGRVDGERPAGDALAGTGGTGSRAASARTDVPATTRSFR